MKEPDFSGIEPLRVPEARRRVAALDEYLALPDPTTADAKRFGERVGLSRWQFQRLARVWREHRRPEMLVVGRRGTATRDYGIDPRASAIAKEVIDRVGPVAAELATVADEIERLCNEASVAPPSRPTIWNYIRKARAAGGGPGEGPPRIVVGRMWFHLPVGSAADARPGADMPTLLVAVALPERAILAHRLSLNDVEPPSVEDLVAELLSCRTPAAPTRPLLLGPDDYRVAQGTLIRCGLEGLRPHQPSVQRELSRAFGGRLGALPTLYRRGLARPKTRRIIQRQDERISAEAATRAIEDAICAANAAAGNTVVPFDIAGAG